MGDLSFPTIIVLPPFLEGGHIRDEYAYQRSQYGCVLDDFSLAAITEHAGDLALRWLKEAISSS